MKRTTFIFILPNQTLTFCINDDHMIFIIARNQSEQNSILRGKNDTNKDGLIANCFS